MGALVLAIVTGWIFYKRLRAADIPGSAEVCIYEDLNKARSEIKRKFEQKRRAFRRLIWKRKASNNDQLKSNYGRLMDLMKAKGLIQVKNDEVSLTKRGRIIPFEARAKKASSDYVSAELADWLVAGNAPLLIGVGPQHFFQSKVPEPGVGAALRRPPNYARGCILKPQIFAVRPRLGVFAYSQLPTIWGNCCRAASSVFSGGRISPSSTTISALGFTPLD